jgi:hypothetical protein
MTIKETLKDLGKVDVLELNNAFILNIMKISKICCKTVKETLKHLGEVDVLEPNNAFILNSREDVKNMLQDYQGNLKGS